MTAQVSDPYFDEDAGTMAVTVTRQDSDGSTEEILADLLAAGEMFAEHLQSGQYTTAQPDTGCDETGCPNPSTVDVTIGTPEAPIKKRKICTNCAIQSLEALAAAGS